MSHARRKRWDRLLFLGDLVGYYPEPERASQRLMELQPHACLLGNHDQLLLQLASGAALLPAEDDIVTSVLERQLRELSAESLAFLGGFAPTASGERWQAVHGALRHPWEYLSSLQAAQSNYPLLEKQLCFVGHTHVPKIFAFVEQGREDLWRIVSFRREHTIYRIPPRAKLFFNPGSVGQPRDGSPLASYALYDEELGVIEQFRVEYDLNRVQRLVLEKGYPAMLAERLGVGR